MAAANENASTSVSVVNWNGKPRQTRTAYAPASAPNACPSASNTAGSSGV